MNMAATHKILLVEDNPGDADLTSERLAEASAKPCDLRLATKLESALALLNDFTPDAVILDLNLPDSNGLKTLQTVKPVAGEAAIIVLSGLVDDALRNDALEHGAEEVFAKNEAGSRLFARSILYVIERNIERNGTRERHRQLQHLLDTTPDAIVVLNHQQRVRYVNHAAVSLFERTREVFIGEALSSIEDNVPAEIRIQRSDGEHVCEVRVVQIEWEHEPARLASIRDVTERKHSEALRARSAELEVENRRIVEANRLKTEFLTNMSHELRTPLNAIIGFTELLQMGHVDPASPKHDTYLGYVLTSARHLLRLINDVLDLAKVEAGKLEFHPEQASVALLVGEVVDGLSSIATQKRITIHVDIDDSLGIVSIDPGRFKQVLYNYLSNALKFTPESGEVWVQTRAEGADEFRVLVRDSGAGIAPNDLERLFVQFQQLDGSLAKQHEGTGLGLALTKRLVETQGGIVGVESTLGEGSTFFAVLPRNAVVARYQDASAAQPAQGFVEHRVGFGEAKANVVGRQPVDA